MASRFHGPSRGPSKASAQTRCQKCLKLGTYPHCSSRITPRLTHSRSLQLRMQIDHQRAPLHLASLTHTATLQSFPRAQACRHSAALRRRTPQGRTRRQHPRWKGEGTWTEATVWHPGTRGQDKDRLLIMHPCRHESPSRRRDESTSSMSSYSSISSSGTPEPQQPRKDVPATQDEDRSVRRKYRDSPSPRRRGRRMSPEGRRSRSRSPPRRISGVVNHIQQEQEAPPVQQQQQQQRTGPRSPSPFTRRRLLTEQMQTGGG